MDMKRILWMMLAGLCCLTAFAQKNYSLKGKVLDVDGRAIGFANVALFRTDSTIVSGVTTGDDGRFVLQAPAGDGYLRISYVGYVELFLPLKNLSHALDLGNLTLASEAIGLSEVTVKAAHVTRKVDRQIIFPTREQLDKSLNGLELTQRLGLPRIFVNNSNHSIGMAGNESVQLRINGVEASSQEVLALSPQDIQRVEYHDNPSARYGDNVGAVIDYITVKRTSGGSVGTSSQQQTNSVGLYQLYGDFHQGKSQFRYSYYTNFHSYNNMYVNKQESFSFPSGRLLERRVEGIPDKQSEILHMGNIGYSYTKDEDFLLNAKFNMVKYDVGKVNNSGWVFDLDDPSYRIYRHQEAPNWLNSPSLDLYMYKKLGANRSLIFDVVGTYNSSHQKSLYQDSMDGTMLTDLFTDVNSKRYSLISELVYEQRFKDNRLSFGMKHTMAKTDNHYTGSTDADTHMRNSDLYAYVELLLKWNKLTCTFGSGMAYTHINQIEGTTLNRWNYRPTAKFLYPLSKVASLRFSYKLRNQLPSLSELSAVEQQVDSLRILKGNPLLHTYLTHSFSLDYDLNVPNCNMGVSLLYELRNHPVMEQTVFDASKQLFVRSYDNQKRFEKMDASLYANISLWKDHVSLYFNGGVTQYLSNGNDYFHRYTNLYYISQLRGSVAKWTLTATFINQFNLFYGETMNTLNKYNEVSLDYRLNKQMRLGLGLMNPFGEYSNSYRSENYSHLTRTTSISHYPLTRVASLSFTWNFDFGKEYKAIARKINNSDSENGILK